VGALAGAAGRVGWPSLIRLLIACLLLLAACSRDSVDRNAWQQMSMQDRVLYVKSLMGGERVKDAKGGAGRTYDRPAEVYVIEIDRAYERGEQRAVPELFAELSR
jgi:hypothetical protein